jgi:Lar family restriction alleviation protein
MKLKSCPFCGGGVSIHQKHIFNPGMGWRVECEGLCHSMTCWWHTKKEAINTWNQRI